VVDRVIRAAAPKEAQVSDENKATARDALEVWSTGELDRLERLVALHVVHQDPYDPRASVRLEGLKRRIALNRVGAIPGRRARRSSSRPATTARTR
jgi:hypothetical protein